MNYGIANNSHDVMPDKPVCATRPLNTQSLLHQFPSTPYRIRLPSSLSSIQSVSSRRTFAVFRRCRFDTASEPAIERKHRDAIRPTGGSDPFAPRENKTSKAIRYLPQEFSRVTRNEFSLRGYTSIKREIPFLDSLSMPLSLFLSSVSLQTS